MAFKAEICEGELHLTLPIGPTVCPLCKVSYPHGFTRPMTEEAFRQSGQMVSMFVGLLGFTGNGLGEEAWGWVHDVNTHKSHCLCGKCYAPIEAARRAGIAAADELGKQLAEKCAKKTSDGDQG